MSGSKQPAPTSPSVAKRVDVLASSKTVQKAKTQQGESNLQDGAVLTEKRSKTSGDKVEGNGPRSGSSKVPRTTKSMGTAKMHKGKRAFQDEREFLNEKSRKAEEEVRAVARKRVVLNAPVPDDSIQIGRIPKRKRDTKDESRDANKKSRKAENGIGVVVPRRERKAVVGAASRSKPVQKADESLEAPPAKEGKMNKPSYIDTLNPKEQLLRQTIRDATSIHKISDQVEVPRSKLQRKGRVTEYNFTQMKWRWITMMLNKLQPVLQQPKMTVRAHKDTLYHSISEANKPMPDNLDAQENKKRSREETWYNEPIYKMLIMEDVFADSDLMVVQLSTTHGDLMTRVDRISEEWIKFKTWLDTDQAKMRGIRTNKAGDFNGFEVTKWTDEDAITRLLRELHEVNDVFEEHFCVAVWKTKLLTDTASL